jgi:low affinity Fe/Cu permease
VFDRFARASAYYSKPWFFAMCVLPLLVWAQSVFLVGIDAGQLIMNTATTIVTYATTRWAQPARPRRPLRPTPRRFDVAASRST